MKIPYRELLLGLVLLAFVVAKSMVLVKIQETLVAFKNAYGFDAIAPATSPSRFLFALVLLGVALAFAHEPNGISGLAMLLCLGASFSLWAMSVRSMVGQINEFWAQYAQTKS